MIASAFLFSAFYFGIFFVAVQVFSNAVSRFYNFPNIWGVLIFGVPLEEIIIGFIGGAFWSVLYEYAKSYKEVEL